MVFTFLVSPGAASSAAPLLLLEIVFEIRITGSFISQLFPDFQYGAFNLNISNVINIVSSFSVELYLMKHVQSLINHFKTLGIYQILDAVELVLKLTPGPDDEVPLLGDQLVKLLDLVQDVNILLRLSLEFLIEMSVNFLTPKGHFLCTHECKTFQKLIHKFKRSCLTQSIK